MTVMSIATPTHLIFMTVDIFDTRGRHERPKTDDSYEHPQLTK